MHPLSSGFLSTLNTWIDQQQVFGALIGAAITGVAGLLVGAYLNHRRLGYTVVYDQQINQGDPSSRALAARRAVAAGVAHADQATQTQHLWNITYADPATGGHHEVTDGSLVVLRVRNIGWRTIKADDWDRGRITLTFPGRRVVHFKIRDNRDYHRAVYDAQRPGGNDDFAAPVPKGSDEFNLPATTLERGEGFEVLTLLEDDPNGPGNDKKPQVTGHITGGRIKEYGGHRRWRYAVTTVLVVALTVAGVIVGVKIANRGLALSPVCAPGGGRLTIEGSTAFAPVFNQVVTEYEQLCPGVQVTVSAVGSVAGLEDLKAAGDKGSVIVMYDGLPDTDPGLAYESQPVGDIIFAVVGNRSLTSQKENVFLPGGNGGMTRQQIADAFLHPVNGGFAPVGREGNSGTRQVFVKTILKGYDDSDSAEVAAVGRPCGPPGAGVCLQDTTMDVLRFASVTKNAIGYAEDDALSFFPNVGAIPVNGFAPTRANALSGDYKFLATEHLYTYGPPRGLAADVISFLTSAPVTAQLRATSFIACADLAGSAALGADCQPG